ncbi:helix-turn-helix domain-containing protein [Actinomycetes bacterium KLBMP 9797]
MTARTYGQFCGVARALELIGERWGVMVIRDLILGPKRFTELQQGLPRIPTSILSSRLNELERAAVIRRRVLPGVDAAVVYELTEYGTDLEPILMQLGLWGARSLTEPGVEDVFTRDAAVLSLYATFRPEHAAGIHASYELHYGPLVLHALVDDGVIKVSEGSYPEADLVIETRGSVRPLLAREISPSDALTQGLLTVTGDPALLDLFVELFNIPEAPQPVEGLAVR